MLAMKRATRPWERISLTKGTILLFSVLFSTSKGLFLTTRKITRPIDVGVTPTCLHASWTEAPLDSVIPQQSTGPSTPVGIYVHIPYCRQRCRYCDFAIVPIGPSAVTEANHTKGMMMDRATRGFLNMDATYRNALVEEISSTKSYYNNTSSIPLQSIYFGGGTPSLAPVKTIRAILHAILNNGPPLFVLLHDAEISMEMDPGTFGIEQLQALKELGINRISLGVQSFHDDVLQSIGRFHRRDDVLQSIDMLREVYGENVNYSMDLISGLPGTSLAMWAETLAMATNLSPRHFSIYDLQIESGTVFSKWYENDGGTLPVPKLPSPDDCAFAYRYASSYLRAKGYEHYEISSYAYKSKDSPSCYYRSRHNQIYWEPKSSWFGTFHLKLVVVVVSTTRVTQQDCILHVLAFGLGATSFVHGNRYARPRALTDYVAWVKNGGTRDAHRARDEACPNTLDWLTDVIMTRLRTSDGLDLDWIKDNVPNGDVVVEQILTGASLGLELGLAARHIHKKKSLGTLRLADPDGFLFSNSIISSIFVELGVDE